MTGVTANGRRRGLTEDAPGITLVELKTLPGAVWVDADGTRYREYSEPITTDRLATTLPVGVKDFGVERFEVLGRTAKGGGTRDGLLRPTKADALSGMSLHKEACVTVRRA